MGKDIEVSEWEIDKSGRRYRRIGNCVEYEPTILTTAGTMTESQRKKFAEGAKNKKGLVALPEQKKPKLCPFRGFKGCRSDCILFSGDGCSMGESVNPSGRYCPVVRKNCVHECVFYENGCKFF